VKKVTNSESKGVRLVTILVFLWLVLLGVQPGFSCLSNLKG
jgi:hypothetical protein